MKTLAFIFICVVIASCDKNNISQPFIGTFAGASVSTNPAGSTPDTMYITAGSGNTSVIVTEAKYVVELNANVSNDSITVPNQYISATGGINATWSGSGTLTGSTLNLTLIASGTPTTTLTFTGAKQ